MKNKWITIKGNHILLKNGETPEQALERLKNGMHKSDRLYEKGEIPKMEKEKWLTKSKKQSIVYLPKKEYGKMCHAIRTRYADKIPKKGSIFLDNHFCKFRYNKRTERLVCTLHISIENNRELINLYIGGENGKDNQ